MGEKKESVWVSGTINFTVSIGSKIYHKSKELGTQGIVVCVVLKEGESKLGGIERALDEFCGCYKKVIMGDSKIRENIEKQTHYTNYCCSTCGDPILVCECVS